MLTMSAYYIGVPYGGMANDDITTARREALGADPYSQEYTMRLAGSKMQIVCWVTYAMTLWCLKGSVLCFFVRRLTVRFCPQPKQISKKQQPALVTSHRQC